MPINEMYINIIFGFVIPWLVAIYLIRKSPKLLLIIFPIGALVSMLINSLGFQMKFWDFTPLIPDDQSVSALPLDVGLYPILACFMIRTILLYRKKTVLIMFLFVLSTTVLESFGLLIDKVTYGNGWNIGYTFLSYLLAFSCVYAYFRLIERFRVL